MCVDDFIKNEKPKRKLSVLTPYRGDLLVLRAKGFSLKQMREYIKTQGVDANESTICSYLNRHLEIKNEPKN